MSNSVDQQVIDFTAVYTGTTPSEINNSTTLSSLGIVSVSDIVRYLTELEDSFGLVFVPSDADGIVTVGDAAAMITKKLGQNAS